ncbi:hypothetical protein pb186bvf_002153 [Paramecium bursaria]
MISLCYLFFSQVLLSQFQNQIHKIINLISTNYPKWYLDFFLLQNSSLYLNSYDQYNKQTNFVSSFNQPKVIYYLDSLNEFYRIYNYIKFLIDPINILLNIIINLLCLPTLNVKVQIIMNNKQSGCVKINIVHNYIGEEDKFNLTDIKTQKMLEEIIQAFKSQNQDLNKNVLLQCQIQKYILNLEFLEFIQYWNERLQQLDQIESQLQEFNIKFWDQITLQNYMDSFNSKLGIFDCLEQIQKKLIDIDEKKNKYLRDIEIGNFESKQFENSSSIENQLNPFVQSVIDYLNDQKDTLNEILQLNEIIIKKQQNCFSDSLNEILTQEGNLLNLQCIKEQAKKYFPQKIDCQIASQKDQNNILSSEHEEQCQNQLLPQSELKPEPSIPEIMSENSSRTFSFIKDKINQKILDNQRQQDRLESAIKYYQEGISYKLIIQGKRLYEEEKFQESINAFDEAIKLECENYLFYLSRSYPNNYFQGSHLLNQKIIQRQQTCTIQF